MMANFRQLLRRGGGTGRAADKRAPSARRRVAIEALESRLLMAGELTVQGPYNVSRNASNQSEPTIAVNPLNTQNVVVLANHNELAGLFYGVSFDGGKSFTSGSIATGTDNLTSACCDASAAFDQFGNLFITYLNSAATTAPVITSTDGGRTLKPLFTIPNVRDQPKLSVGPGGPVAAGSLWVEYLDRTGQIGGVGFPVTGLGAVGTPTAAQLIGGSAGNFGKPSIGPKGQVMFTYEEPAGGAGPASLYFSVDPDGLNPASGFGASIKYSDVNVGGFTPIPAQPLRTIDSEVGVAYDNSGGPRNGRVYILFTNNAAVNDPNTDVYVAYSDNDGATWSPRIKANDDSGKASQFNPRIAVDQFSGNVAVSFYDTRDDIGSGSFDTDGKANTDTGFYVTVSVDGGKSFVPNVRVSNGPSNSTLAGGNNNSGNDYGDYTGLAFARNVLYPVWADNSNALGNNPGGRNLDIATAQVTVQSLTVTPAAFVATEATPFTGVVATFKPSLPGIPASSFAATINWGDGVTSDGSIVISSGRYQVVGTHTYPEGGNYPVVVTVMQSGGGTATGSGTVTVQGLPFNVSGTTINLREGDNFAGVLAHFDDTSPVPQTAGHYTARINFGDGSNGVGAIIANPTGGFDVIDQSGHLYGGGNYNIITTITDPGYAATASTTAIVTDSALRGFGLDVSPLEGAPFRQPLATFTDGDPRVPSASNYFATIDYGDNTTGPGTIVANPFGAGFAVVGNHPYNVGSYSVVVTIGNLSGGNTTVALGTADVKDAPLTSQGYDFNPTAGDVFKGIIATFADTDPRNNGVGNYAARVDWGDGVKELAQVDVNMDGGYLVRAQHAYRARVLPYTITTTISDVRGGSTTVATGTATVPDAQIALTALGSSFQEGVLGQIVLASFTTPNLLARASDYSATINYGDGTSGDATIQASDQPTATGALFFVKSFKTFEAAGTYNFRVVVNSPGGDQVEAAGSLDVSAAAVRVQPVAIAGLSKTALTNVVVSTFTSDNPRAVASGYVSQIRWGDGTTSAGTIAANGLAGFTVTGSHVYAAGGIYSVHVSVTGSTGSPTSAVDATATIDNLLTPISGGAMAGPGGAISSTGLTNSSQPIFVGTAEPFANVQVFATSPGGSAALVASGKTDSSGNYALTSVPMGDGQYVIAASATDGRGHQSSGLTMLYPTASRGLLTVDTQGPKVTSAKFDPSTGKVTISLADGLSGLAAGTLNAANFTLASPTGRAYAVTGLTVTPVSPNTQQTVRLSFATGKRPPRGRYVLTINAGGVSDLAGNVLDERYFVPFPGLYNRPGQDFIAVFNTDGRSVSQATQFVPPPEILAARNHGLFVRKHLRFR